MAEKHDDAKMPPIPDGGLSESMPDWLRRPPAWRTLQDADVVQTEPVHTAELPEPDTSVIDPRTFLTDDDLPLWLRNMGRSRRRASAEQAGDDEAVSEDRAPDSVADQPVAEPGEPMRSRPEQISSDRSARRFVPRTPPIVASNPPAPSKQTDRHASTPIGGRQQPALRWWQGTPMAVLLAGLLVIAVVVIVILAAM